MRNPLLLFAAFLAAGLIAIGAGGVVAQGTPESQPSPVAGGASHPAHIHNGTCATLGDVVAPLGDISAAHSNDATPMAMDTEMVGSAQAIPVLSSITTVDMAFADIIGSDHAINVHESSENIQNYVACGDVGGVMIGELDILFGLAELNGSGLSGVASLHDNGDGTTTVYVYLTSGAAGGMATPVASPAAAGGDSGTPVSGQSDALTVNMVDIAFDPAELSIPADTDVTITAINDGALPHTFTITDAADTGEVAAGESATVTVNLPAGEYEFICTVPGHADAGMVGTLTVG
jgi:plastocyanin